MDSLGLIFEYSDGEYYYVRNGQNDITSILDSSGGIVVSYEYDTWGKMLSIEDGAGNDISGNASHIADLNPFRYRGYYYDSETGLFYVGARYYDPEIGRWLSPEPNVYSGEFDEGAGLLAYNVYAYCANNPVNYYDPSGEAILTCILVGAGIGLILGAIGGWAYAKHFNIPKNQTWKYVLGGALIGAVIGGCIGYAIGASAGSGAVLWSGKGMGEAAAAFAKQNGLKVLGQTMRGRLLNVLSKKLSYSIMRPLWDAASARFLLSYAGKQTFVHVFITAANYGDMKTVFNSVEMQVIAELGLKIIWHFVK